MKVISFYTDPAGESYYKEKAASLIQSLKEKNIDFIIKSLNGKYSWLANTRLKPQFILDQLTKLQEPVLFVDCDIICQHAPKIEKYFEDYDVLAHLKNHYNKTKTHQFYLYASCSPLYFNPTGKPFLEYWNKLCQTMPKEYSAHHLMSFTWHYFLKNREQRLGGLPKNYVKVTGQIRSEHSEYYFIDKPSKNIRKKQSKPVRNRAYLHNSLLPYTQDEPLIGP